MVANLPYDTFEDCFAHFRNIHLDRVGGQATLTEIPGGSRNEPLNNPEEFAVYSMFCEPRKKPVLDHAQEVFGYVPEWVEASRYYKNWVYVGLSQNVQRRYQDHVNGDGRASNFTKIYKPKQPFSVEFFPNYSTARDYELKFAQVFRTLDNVFVPYKQIR